MYSLPYFPFDKDEYDLPMNVAALKPDRLIEVDRLYEEEVALKGEILAHDYDEYCILPEPTLPLQWEALEILLPNIVKHDPDHFSFEENGNSRIWKNRRISLRQEFIPGDESTLPFPPLEWIGRQVQEDLLIMETGPEGESRLAGGVLCFPAMWGLKDKIGKELLQMHEPVPGFAEKLGRPSTLMMQRLKPGRPAWRLNWSIAVTDRLNLSPVTFHEWAHLREEITSDNAGDRCYLRLERQTFTRLPKTAGILFTIRTYRAPISDLEEDPGKVNRLRSVLKTMPSATLEYKGMIRYAPALMAYLDSLCQDSSGDKIAE